MKRAEVNRAEDPRWYVHVYTTPLSGRDEHLPIAARKGDDNARNYPTHAQALTAALEAVGLTPTNPEKEQA